MEKTPDISVIIVNTNDKIYIKDCLKSLVGQKGQLKLEILVVDNASTDGSVKLIKNSFPHVKLIQNKANLLYTAANNRGLDHVSGTYFLILNPDTRLHPTTLSRMYRFMETHTRAGLAGARQVNEWGKIFPICHRFFTLRTHMLLLPLFFRFIRHSSLLHAHEYADWDRKSTRKVDAIPGSFMFGRSQLLKRLGLLDETLTMFYSDDDYCLRVKLVDYEVWYLATCTITHFTSKTISRLPFWQITLRGYKDLTMYVKKHFGQFWSLVFYILTRVSIVISMVYSLVRPR